MAAVLTPSLAPTVVRTRHSPLVLWHLLSLDAPTVATLWTVFVARVVHAPLPRTLPPAMFVAVWLLYAADRLLDARLLDARLLDARTSTAASGLEARHLFHRRHARTFQLTVCLAASIVVPLTAFLPRPMLLLFVVLAILLGAWFLLLHLVQPARKLPKELTAAAFFAATLSIATGAPLRIVLLFAALCALNLFLISCWEAPAIAPAQAPRTGTSQTLATPATLLLLLCAGLCFGPSEPTQHLVRLAIALAAAALCALHYTRHRFARTTLRALADLALLTPLLLWPWLW